MTKRSAEVTITYDTPEDRQAALADWTSRGITYHLLEEHSVEGGWPAYRIHGEQAAIEGWAHAHYGVRKPGDEGYSFESIEEFWELHGADVSTFD